MSANANPSDEVCIVGMGYVGSSLAAVFADQGLQVHGIDIDTDRVESINRGECPIEEETITDLFETAAADGLITATASYESLAAHSTIIVTVGTPLDEANPDTSAVEAAAASIAAELNDGDLVVFRSTLPAGATEETIRPILEEESKLKAGEDFALAFCPERMAEGSAYDDLTSLPIVVGGYTDDCRKRTEAFWKSLGNETVPVSSPTAAELAKLADNWWIDLNIAMANEVALLAEEVGVDAMEVIEAANSLPKGQHHVNILYPGAGVGGSCLVKDPWFVANLGEKHGLDLQTPRTSRTVNDRMPDHVVTRATETIEHADESSIALLGYAFKGGTDDVRNTPATEIAEGLLESGATLRVSDPFVSASEVESEIGITPQRLRDALSDSDVVVIATGHDQYHELSAGELIELVGREEFTVVDGRFTFSPADFEGTDVEYLGIGRGQTISEANTPGDRDE